jgi:predicted PurR-regulated permease PerM
MIRWLLYLAFIVIGWAILTRLAPVLTPILAAAAIAYLLDPLVERMVARGIRRATAASLLLVSFLTAITVAIVVLVPLIAHDLARFIEELPSIIDSAAAWGADQLGYELTVDSWRDLVSEDQLKAFLHKSAMPILSMAAAVMGGAFSLLAHLAELLLIPVFAFYFLLDWNNIVLRVKRMIPQRHRGQVVDVVTEIDGVVAGWIRGQLTVTAILAVLYAIAFKIIGVQLAITMGLLVGLLTIIPFLGTIVGAGITAALLFADWHGWGPVAATGGVFIVLHLLEAAVLTPKIVGHRVGLGEVGALFAVLAGGKLLGFTGVLLAVPLAASIAVLVRRLVRYYEQSEFFTDGAEEAWVAGAADVVTAEAEVPPEAEATDDTVDPDGGDADDER